MTYDFIYGNYAKRYNANRHNHTNTDRAIPPPIQTTGRISVD